MRAQIRNVKLWTKWWKYLTDEEIDKQMKNSTVIICDEDKMELLPLIFCLYTSSSNLDSFPKNIFKII